MGNIIWSVLAPISIISESVQTQIGPVLDYPQAVDGTL